MKQLWALIAYKTKEKKRRVLSYLRLFVPRLFLRPPVFHDFGRFKSQTLFNETLLCLDRQRDDARHQRCRRRRAGMLVRTPVIYVGGQLHGGKQDKTICEMNKT